MKVESVIKTGLSLVIMVVGVSLLGVGIPRLIQAPSSAGSVYDDNMKSGLSYTISGAVLFLIGYKFF